MCLSNLFYKIFHPTKQYHKKESFNYDNLLNSMFNSDDIYKSLAKKCHPDLYTEELKEEADIIFKELQKKRHDINGMQVLRSKVEDLYNRNFDKS